MYTTEKGINIKDYNGMRTYFNYQHVRKIILEDRELNYDMVASVVYDSNQEGAGILFRVITDNLENLFHGEDALGLFYEGPNTDEWTVDLDALETFLHQFDCEYEDILVNIAREATGNGGSLLDGKRAYDLLLFCSLFAFLHLKPSEDNVTSLRDNLNLNPFHVAAQGDQNEIQISTSPTELPCYQHQLQGAAPKLKWVVIHNGINETALITLSGCPLQRHLAPKEKLLALTADGGVVAFLPRLCTIQNGVVRQEGNDLLVDSDGISLGQDGAPVAFAESHDYGYLIADMNGKLLSNADMNVRLLSNSYPNFAAPENIRWLKGDVQDYGFLTPDGTYCGSLEMKGWKNLLLFDLSGENSVALTADRRAIDSCGRVLGEDIAAVSCCGSSYALLRMNGTVVLGQRGADPIETEISDAHAVCADEKGYWIATDKKLIRLGKDGSWSEEYDCKMDEMERDNTGMSVYGLCADGDILCLSQG